MHKLCGFWKIMSQIWNTFIVQNWHRFFRLETNNVPERNQVMPPGPKQFNGRVIINQFMWLRNLLAVGTDKLGRDQKLSCIQKRTMSEDLGQERKNSRFSTKWLRLWTRQTESVLWLYGDTVCTSQKVPMQLTPRISYRERERQT